MNPNGHVSAESRLITPAYALALLERVKNVRSVRPEHVHNLAEAMRSGRWEENGDTIKIDPDDVVIDGEHRLRACVEAGVSFRTLVAVGVRESITIDTCSRPRTARQLLSASGATWVTTIAAIARLALTLERDGDLQRCANAADRIGITLQDLYGYCKKNQAALEAAAELGHPAGVAAGLPAGALGLVAYRAAKNPKMLPFMAGMRTGEGLQRGSPIYALRERSLAMTRHGGARGKFFDSCATVFKAWNAYARGEVMHNLRWQGIKEKIQTPLE